MAQTRTSSSKTDVALGAAQESVRASIEAAQRVQRSLKDVLDALRGAPSGSTKAPSTQTAGPSRRSA